MEIGQKSKNCFFCWRKYLFPHLGRIAARAHTGKNMQSFYSFGIFPVHGKNGLRWPQIGPGGFFPTNPDLANILGRTDLDFDFFFVFDFLDPNFHQWIPINLFLLGGFQPPRPLAGGLQPPAPPRIPRGSASRALRGSWYQALGQIFSRVMGLFFGPLGKIFWSHGPLFWTP